ncbi:hypothetical protein HYC85_029969 [Camellia sinensis]|uniref:Uncharacterized protein n=1 Tax=Camellia sinensis TaxID=4442 RepID=A0A7J7G234_CAMSI|nr:hypothetical protein HYC85_029969 [Camellia sinensis]
MNPINQHSKAEETAHSPFSLSTLSPLSDKATSYGGAWTWSTGLYEENYFLPVQLAPSVGRTDKNKNLLTKLLLFSNQWHTLKNYQQSAVDGLTPDGGARREGLPSVPPMADLEPQQHNSRRSGRGRRNSSPRHSQSPDRQRRRIDPQALEDRVKEQDELIRKMAADMEALKRQMKTKDVATGEERKHKTPPRHSENRSRNTTPSQGESRSLRTKLVTPGLRGRDPKDHTLKEARIGLRTHTKPDLDRQSCPGHLTYEPCSKKKHDARRMPGHAIHTESLPYNGWLLGRMEASRLECQYHAQHMNQRTKP